MATTRGTKSATKTAAKNQKAAAKRTTKKTAKRDVLTDETATRRTTAADRQAADEASRTTASRTADPGTSEALDASAAYGTANPETQKAAAGYAQTGQPTNLVADPSLTGAVDLRQSRIAQAVSEQQSVAKQGAEEVRQHEEAAAASHEHVMNNLEAPLRAPSTNAMQKPLEPGQVGVHPDVTSPTTLMGQEQPALPGTGVADPRDLAPGQDMSPSPPQSSSNILPQPDKPGTNFSKI